MGKTKEKKYTEFIASSIAWSTPYKLLVKTKDVTNAVPYTLTNVEGKTPTDCSEAIQLLLKDKFPQRLDKEMFPADNNMDGINIIYTEEDIKELLKKRKNGSVPVPDNINLGAPEEITRQAPAYTDIHHEQHI